MRFSPLLSFKCGRHSHQRLLDVGDGREWGEKRASACTGKNVNMMHSLSPNLRPSLNTSQIASFKRPAANHSRFGGCCRVEVCSAGTMYRMPVLIYSVKNPSMISASLTGCSIACQCPTLSISTDLARLTAPQIALMTSLVLI